MNEDFYKQIIEESLGGYAYHRIICDENGIPCDYEFIEVNETYEQLTGLRASDIIGRRVTEIIPAIRSSKYDWIEIYGDIAINGGKKEIEQFSEPLNKWYKVHVYSPERYYFITNYIDISMEKSKISEMKMLETALSNEKRLLETTLISVGDGVISTDNKGNIVFMNKVAEFLTGWRQETAKGKSVTEIFEIVNEGTRAKSINVVKKVLDSMKKYEPADHKILISKDGIERPIEVSAAPITQDSNEIEGVVLVFRDFSEKKQKQEKIEFLSYHDQLTGLFNRRYFENEIKRLDDERYVPLTLAMVDVNGLKLTNDAFGHKVGDALLEIVARILKKACRAEDIVARIGGDEFVLLLPETDALNADIIIKRINLAIAKEKIENVVLSISIGSATKLDMSENISEVFKKAENDMYRNKLTESTSMRSRTIELIMNTLYEKNNRELVHSKNVSEISMDIASNMNFDNEDISQIKIAGLMHDIGKIGIDDRILNKPQRLNDDEWNETERHSEIGYRILNSADEYMGIAKYVLELHEKWNGEGYPRGLKGEEISLQARVIAVADAYDAMTSDTVYSKAVSSEEAAKEIVRCSGTQFDPDVVKVFINEVLGKHESKIQGET